MMKYQMKAVGWIVLTLMLAPTFTTPSYSQTPIQWLTHTSNNCKLTIDYPSTWTVKEKQGRFDTSMEGELKISNNNPSVQNLPSIIFTICEEYDNQTTLLGITNILEEKMASSTKIVDYPHLEKNLIGGRDAGVFAVMSEHIGIEEYNVINGTILYQFSYMDLVDHFDGPEGKQVRDHILKSIKFLP